MPYEEADFHFDLNVDRRLLRIIFKGLWTVETVGRYRLARAKAIRDANLAGISNRDLVLLVDRRSQPVQTQDVVEALGAAIVDNDKIARKTAVLVTSALHLRQIGRTAPSTAVRTFESEPEAITWLQFRD